MAGTGVNMAKENWVLALLSLVTAVVVSMKAKGLFEADTYFLWNCSWGIWLHGSSMVWICPASEMPLGLDCRSLSFLNSHGSRCYL